MVFIHDTMRRYIVFLLRGEYFIFTLDDSTAPEIHMRVWDRKSFHYDNCAMAMITLFAVQTSEGWIA